MHLSYVIADTPVFTRVSDEQLDMFNEHFYYEDGQLYWRWCKAHWVKADDLVGNEMKGGYRQTQLNGTKWLVHRIIYAMHHGVLPEVIDHIDMNPRNNSIENLRASTKGLNAHNTTTKSISSSGRRGVSWNKGRGCWEAYIKIDKRRRFLGYHTTKRAAIAAREGAEMALGLL